jgi:sarcosine oxidase, subunit beta
MARRKVIIVGGGILGAATAFHLATADATDVVLLERNDLGQGTTAAGAGFIATWAAGNIPA